MDGAPTPPLNYGTQPLAQQVPRRVRLPAAFNPPRPPAWTDAPDHAVRPVFGKRPGERPDEDASDIVTKSWRLARYSWREATRARLLKHPIARAARRIEARREAIANEPDDRRTQDRLVARIAALRPVLRAEGLGGPATEETFALVSHLLGHTHGLTPYTVQLEGAWALLMGLLAEMRTGEGKTLTAVMTAAVAALGDVPTHVVTVNAYLAARDAEFAKPLLDALGLRLAVVDQTLELEDRRAAYACDVVYAVNKQLAFDYLRDRIQARGTGSLLELTAAQLASDDMPAPAMRGLHFAIIDEADSVLIDEARTPLVISQKRPNPDLVKLAQSGLMLARMLEAGRHYTIDAKERRVELTEPGRRQIRGAKIPNALLLRGRRRREAAATLGLVALHLLNRGEHYVVSDGTVAIVDEYTGRFMPDRSWGQGLQQMVELKEGVSPSDPTETIGQITFQRFFRRYRAIAGMTGTAREIRREMWFVYRLAMVAIRPRFPPRLRRQGVTVMQTADQKWARVAERAAELSEQRRAVLVGARTIAASQAASAALTAAGLDHEVLNAENDAAEAEIIAQAGQLSEGRGRITVATNMAGRGTDIKLSEPVIAAGGLAVILSERHDASRIDRQLMGRAARQNEPGSYEIILSLEDDLIKNANLARAARLVSWHLRWSRPLGQLFSRQLFAIAQGRLEAVHAKARAASVANDRKLVRLLAFTGPLE